ncbi:hypothetical protein [Paenibacillus tuaregi]|uniref:hypothetical protein n=1 Tax=Paenibacillus tuaregi TaxID=1816681 RepID=UPI000838BE6F|nr:hypothetical protein [Paenibacillus tuaregi]
MLFKKISKAIFLATISASLSIGGTLAIPNSTSVYAESTAKQPNKEVAKMYRVSHELQFDLKGTRAKLEAAIG